MAAIEPIANDEENLILNSVDRFLERDVRPYVRELEDQDIWPEEIVEKMKALGLFGATISPEYGGLGLGATTYSKIVERVSAVWMSVSGIFNSHLIMSAAVERFGSEEMKAHYLPKFASGEMRGAIGLTEPDCGTDLQGIRTRATRQGDKYIVNGTKTWISNSVYGDVLGVLVKTDSDAMPPHKGMSLLLIEKKFPGFSVAKKLKKLGYKGIDTGELLFEDCRGTGREPHRRRRPRSSKCTGWNGTRAHQRGGPRLRHRPGLSGRSSGLRPRSARPSANQSPNTNPYRLNWPKWQPASKHRGCLRSLPRAPTTPASDAIWKRAWQNYLLPKPPCTTAWRRCGSTVPTATPRSSTSNATTVMRRYWRSAKGPTSYNALSSRGLWSKRNPA